MGKKEVIWSPKAVGGFDKVVRYLENEWSEKEVTKFILAVDRIIEKLGSGRIQFRSSGRRKIHEVLIAKHNRLIYKKFKDKIELMVLYDTRQHPKRKKYR